MFSKNPPIILDKNKFDQQRHLWLDFFSGEKLSSDIIVALFNDWEKFVSTLEKVENNPQYQMSILSFKNYFQRYCETSSNKLPSSLKDLKNALTNLPVVKPNIDTVRNIIATEVYNQHRQEIIADKIFYLKHEEKFFTQLKTHIFDSINQEIGRLEEKYNYNDARIGMLQTFYDKLNSRIDKVMQDELMHQYSEINNQSAQKKILVSIKQKCKSEVTELIKTDLLNNSSLHQHRIWGTKFGRILLNAMMCITIVPALAKTIFHKSHSPCLTLKSNSEQNVEKIYHAAKKL